MFFNTKISKDIHEAEVIIMFKVLFYSNYMVFPTLNLINKELLRFLSGNFLVFLSTYRQYQSLVIWKKNY